VNPAARVPFTGSGEGRVGDRCALCIFVYCVVQKAPGGGGGMSPVALSPSMGSGGGGGVTEVLYV